MAQLDKLTKITEQKRLVQVQSEICRRSIQLEWEGVKLDTAWVGRSMEWLNRYRTVILLLAAPVGGVLLVRRGRLIRRLFLQGFAAWQLLRRAGTLTSWLRGRR
jgi:hypothetical protein